MKHDSNHNTARGTCKSLDGLVTVLVDALVKYTSTDCIQPFVPTVLSPSCPDIGLPIVNPVMPQADLVQYIMMNLPGAAADAQYFWENALEPCLGVFMSLGSVYADSDVVTREEHPTDVTAYFAMLAGYPGGILDDASFLPLAAHIMMLTLFLSILRLSVHLGYSTWVAKELKGSKSGSRGRKHDLFLQQRDRLKELERAIAAVLKMRGKRMWASAMTTAVAKASPGMAFKLEPQLQELTKKHVLRNKLAHDIRKCFTPLQETKEHGGSHEVAHKSSPGKAAGTQKLPKAASFPPPASANVATGSDQEAVTLVDPVIAADGYTYERTAVQCWLQTHETSPVTSAKLAHNRLVPNVIIKSAIASSCSSTS
ncbi:TPA: hypothetical protein ACH3X3_003067 [Trebouxia sp. C0006]